MGEDAATDRDELADLVRRARAGDSDAFATLYARYYPTVLGFLRRRTTSAGVAEDIAADTFLRAFTSIGSYEWRDIELSAWLCAIARNRLADHYRSSRRRREICSDELPDWPAADNPEAQALATVAHDVVIEAINALPDTQRDCLTWRFIHNRSIADTALLLGRSESAVKQIQARARRSLGKKLAKNTTRPADRLSGLAAQSSGSGIAWHQRRPLQLLASGELLER